MGMVVAGGGEGLTREQYRRNGVEDYTPDFRAERPVPAAVFGGLLNQDESLERFVETLALDVRGRLNLGAAGVGKTTCIQALFEALEKLDRGEEIEGPYAEQIKAYHRERHSHPRGEILALWNPKDYHKPIFFRTRDALATESLEDILRARNGELIEQMHVEAAGVVHEALLRQRILETLSAAYRAREHDKGDTAKLKWTLPKRKGTVAPLTYRPGASRGAQAYWNRTVRGTLLDLTRTNTREEAVRTMREILALGDDAMENEQPYLQRLRDDAQATLDGVVLRWVDRLAAEGATWDAQEQVIATWYRSVADYLRDERNRVTLLTSLWGEGQLNMTVNDFTADENKGKGKRRKRITSGGLDDDDLHLFAGGHEFSLADLLAPSRKRGPAGASLIIRSPTVQAAMELFISTDYRPVDDDEPLHHQLDLGELAYADIVFLDDGLADVIADRDVRQALLTYLSEGRISLVNDKTQVECKSNCHLFACETAYPFRRQIYEGTDPERDDGMERRFAITEWSSVTDHSPRTVESFPRLVAKTTKDVRTFTGIGVDFDPEALNLLYQHLIGNTEPSLLFPLAVGQMSKELFQPIAARVSGQGRATVTADDVRSFLDSRRSDIKRVERHYIGAAISQHPQPRAGRLIGHVNKLYAGDGFGGVMHLTASVEDRFVPLQSADKEAGLVDETYAKGLQMTDAWLHKNFGPLRLGVRLSANTFGQTGGPSSSAVNTYASLSVLGEIPIDQNAYVTGTVLDLEGNVGVIGGVFEKTRGALLYHRQRFEGHEVPPMRVLIPENNAREFMRQTLLDKAVADALRDGSLEVRTHENVWDGFSDLAGIPRNEWEPRVRKRIDDETRRLVGFEADLKEPKRRARTGQRVYR